MSFDLFAPQGGNPLGQLKVVTPRCARVDFDRSVRSNVLVMDGDVTQSKIQLPKEDRPLHSLQLPQPIVGLQLMCPSNGQLAIEFTLSHSNMARLRVTAGTFISRADVHDAKGTPHVKLPFAIPRNVWTQAIVHISGVVCHLFKLPPVKWVDSITISGTARIRRIFASPDEAHALEKPSGMLLFTVPAYGPPVWRGASAGVSQQQAPGPQEAAADAAADGGANHGGKTPFTMRFSRQANGEVTFSAASKGQLERQQQQERQQAALREKQLLQQQQQQQQQLLQGQRQNDSPANVMQHLPNDGVGGRETPPVGVDAWEGGEVEDDETVAGAGGMPTRSPRTQAIVAALQGRPPHGMQPGRTNSAPAGSLAVSYRRLVRESKQREAPLSTGYGIPRRDVEPKKSAAEIAAAEAEAAWGCVVLDGWADDDEEEADLSAAIAVAKTLGLDPATPPQAPSGEKRSTPPPLSPAAQKAPGAKPPGAAAGPSGRAPAAGQSTPTARGSAASGSTPLARPAAGGPGGRSSSRPAGGRGGPAVAAAAASPTQVAPAAAPEDDLLAACAKGALRSDSQQFTFVPKKDRVVGFGVGDLEVERTRSSSDDDTSDDDDESDDTDDSDSDSDAPPANRRRPGYAAPVRGGGARR